MDAPNAESGQAENAEKDSPFSSRVWLACALAIVLLLIYRYLAPIGLYLRVRQRPYA